MNEPICSQFSSRQALYFYRSSSGASTIEQALFIAIVIGASLAGIEALGLVSESTFSTVAGTMTPGDARRAPDSSGSASSPTAHKQTFNAAAFAATHWRFVVLLAVCPLGAVCWYWLYRDTRKKAAAEEAAEIAPAKAEEDSLFAKRHDLLRVFSGDVGMFFTSRMCVRQIMTRKVLTVAPTATLEEVRSLLAEKKIRHLIVCDAQDRLRGVIAEHDVHRPGAKFARDVMATDVATVEPDSLVNPAVTLILQKRISCLPVVENQRVVGVVTTSDLLMALQCTLHALQRAGAEAVANLPPETVPGFMIAALEQYDASQPSESLMAATSP